MKRTWSVWKWPKSSVHPASGKVAGQNLTQQLMEDYFEHLGNLGLDSGSRAEEELPSWLESITMRGKGQWDAFHAADQLAMYDDFQGNVVATDGSVGQDKEGLLKMGAGIYPRGCALPQSHFEVTGEPGEIASMIPEGAAIHCSLEILPKNEDALLITDCAVMLFFIWSIIMPTFWRPYDYHRFAPMLDSIARCLHQRTGHTHFVKVKAHQYQALNEGADVMANKGRTDPQFCISYSKNPNHNKAEVKVKLPGGDGSAQDESLLRATLEKLQTYHSLVWRSSAPVTITEENLIPPGLGHALRAEVLAMTGPKGLNDRNKRQILQAIGGRFPTKANLYAWNLAKSPACDMCSCSKQTIGHLQCDCPQLANARQQAHNNIWNNTWKTLETLVIKHKWKSMCETAMRKTPFSVNLQFENYQPDGILWKHSKDTKETTVLLLDLGRNRGYNVDIFSNIERAKVEHYQALVLDMQVRNPSTVVKMLPLPIGYTGNISETHWETLASELNFTHHEAKKLYVTASMEGAKAFTYMIDMWRVAQQEIAKGSLKVPAT